MCVWIKEPVARALAQAMRQRMIASAASGGQGVHDAPGCRLCLFRYWPWTERRGHHAAGSGGMSMRGHAFGAQLVRDLSKPPCRSICHHCCCWLTSRRESSSSRKVGPNTLAPPRPVPVGSPPCAVDGSWGFRQLEPWARRGPASPCLDCDAKWEQPGARSPAGATHQPSHLDHKVLYGPVEQGIVVVAERGKGVGGMGRRLVGAGAEDGPGGHSWPTSAERPWDMQARSGLETIALIEFI